MHEATPVVVLCGRAVTLEPFIVNRSQRKHWDARGREPEGDIYVFTRPTWEEWGAIFRLMQRGKRPAVV